MEASVPNSTSESPPAGNRGSTLRALGGKRVLFSVGAGLIVVAIVLVLALSRTSNGIKSVDDLAAYLDAHGVKCGAGADPLTYEIHGVSYETAICIGGHGLYSLEVTDSAEEMARHVASEVEDPSRLDSLVFEDNWVVGVFEDRQEAKAVAAALDARVILCEANGCFG